MTKPDPPHRGKSTNKSPSFKVMGHPSGESLAEASLINSQEMQDVSIRFIAKPISRVST